MKAKSDPGLPLKSSRLSWPSALIIATLLAIVGIVVIVRSFGASGQLSFEPSVAKPGLGTSFSVRIKASSGSDAVNAVEANVTFPADKLRLDKVDTSSSGFVTEAFTKPGSGTVSIVRGQVPPGLTGDQTVAILNFTAIATGDAALSFDNDSALVSASNNTNILVARNGTTVNVADLTAPSAPTGLDMASSSMNSIGLTWSPASDNVGVTGYVIYRDGTQIGTSPTNTYTATGLSASKAYSFAVAAVDAAGNISAKSSVLSLTTKGDTTAPSVPGVPTATGNTLSSINLAWTPSSDDVAVAGYRVFRGGTLIATVTSPSYNDSGLSENTNYSYRVAAFDASGNTSVQSAAANLSTASDTTPPSVPANLSSSTNDRDIRLTWTASTDNIGVAGYKVYRDNVEIASVQMTSYTDAGRSYGTYSYSVAAFDTRGNLSAKASATSVQLVTRADLNKDGKVNVQDLSILLANWNKSGADGRGDINGDGKVAIQDLSILLASWTK